MSKFTAEFSDRMGRVEAAAKDLTDGQAELKQEIANISNQLTALSHSRSSPNLIPQASDSPSISPSSPDGPPSLPPKDSVTASRFWRQPDDTVLFCNVVDKVAVTRERFAEAIFPLLEVV